MTRELVVTVKARFDLGYLERLYADDPHGTLNAFIEDWAHSVIEDMQGHASDCSFEHGWELTT